MSASKEMVVYCFDTLLAHYNSEETPAPAFDGGQQYAYPSLYPSFILYMFTKKKNLIFLGCLRYLFPEADVEFFSLVVLYKKLISFLALFSC